MISLRIIIVWSWEIFMLPFITNQAIIYCYSNNLALALSLVAISLLTPHLIVFTWHYFKMFQSIPDFATGEVIERKLKLSFWVFLNLIFDFSAHFVVFLYIATNCVGDSTLPQEHLYSYTNFIGEFLVPLLLFEIIYDFFYYWWHYYGHKNQWLWKLVRSKHHEIKYPVYLDLYHNHFCDFLFIRLLQFTMYYVCSFSTFKLSTMVLVQNYTYCQTETTN